ncbi:UAA transporter [Dentipellis sp. KUC8613]|nr:UAA transporter [Dentipellis sp. KUC8613]
MSSRNDQVVFGLTFALLTDWFTTFSLVFGGCCSNALTLERVTSQYPKAGTLITFCQFLVISLHGLPKFLTTARGPLGLPIPCLKPRRIPLTPYIIQVALFCIVSLLNNAAFAYAIPMPVHIIFRSGGLIISMLMGWLISGRKYTVGQVVSVLFVTFGVILTTLSASHSKKSKSTLHTSEASPVFSLRVYLTGIGILTLALVLSGFLGIVQDRTYSHYGNYTSKSPPSKAPNAPAKPGASSSIKAVEPSKDNLPDTWEESMFYLHFLSLPMFAFVRDDLMLQARALTASARTTVLPVSFTPYLPGVIAAPLKDLNLPSAILPLLLNTLTQLLCSAGVNRLTTRVAALTVTLVLVVRKAVSLILSVVFFRGNTQLDPQAWIMLWSGAALVFAGTVGYTMSGKGKPKAEANEKKTQ